MVRNKRVLAIAISLLVLAFVAWLGGIAGKKSGKTVRGEGEHGPGRCVYDGTRIPPLYQVTAYLSEGRAVNFCSVYCAGRWFERNRDGAIYLTVIDEVSGERLDSSLAHFVESDVVTVPEVNNRVHSFFLRDEALKHADRFNGKLIQNPFGSTFTMPVSARLPKLKVAVPRLPDGLPVHLATVRPIFKENLLDVEVVSHGGEGEDVRMFLEGAVEGFICDLPSALLVTRSARPARIVKNVLRANPYRPLFALVGVPNHQPKDARTLKGGIIAVPRGLSFRFYAEHFLKMLDIPLHDVVLKETDSQAEAWGLLESGEAAAAVLRTPYTDMARERKRISFADDRNTPWMSVMVFSQAVLEKRRDVIERFVFGLEQSVLALNLRPGEFRAILREQAGLPEGEEKRFPMPIFEGANCPSHEEVEGILKWLARRGHLPREIQYHEIVDTRFLPNPTDVGLAFCCR